MVVGVKADRCSSGLLSERKCNVVAMLSLTDVSTAVDFLWKMLRYILGRKHTLLVTQKQELSSEHALYTFLLQLRIDPPPCVMP